MIQNQVGCFFQQTVKYQPTLISLACPPGYTLAVAFLNHSIQLNPSQVSLKNVSNHRHYRFNVRDCGLAISVENAKLSVITDINGVVTEIADMKRDETPLLSPARVMEARELGEKLARLRKARRLRQADAALRAGLARSTAALIEKGDLGRTQAQILRYLEAIAPGVTLLSLLQESDPSLAALSARELTRRVRPLGKAELDELNF